MDSLLFAKGPQMGNKMFVQLFNVKNIHFGAWILCLASARLRRLQWRGWWEGSQKHFQRPRRPCSGARPKAGDARGQHRRAAGSRPRCPCSCLELGSVGQGTACSGAAEGSRLLFALPCPPAGCQREAAAVRAPNCRGLTVASWLLRGPRLDTHSRQQHRIPEVQGAGEWGAAGHQTQH